ncbi:MAG: hypothetical protein A2270_08965 [Elusimicrobia bacterium RIFOXYA12_FULL_51_18]|nr:MAG: hypothetical protein A2270_08965 [Elusimicrobia bacterium RIFOXYA12_FULL_51_18]OGS31651.1 MAG: hypothetical protein A2218_05905 [Elusimicrobia bacterium RIFOXYA2_FULL_53_38]
MFAVCAFTSAGFCGALADIKGITEKAAGNRTEISVPAAIPVRMAPEVSFGAMLGTLTAAAKGACEKTAASATEKKFKDYFFENGKRIRTIENVTCERKKSKDGVYYKSCALDASNGEGAGDVSFNALLNDSCTGAFSIFITGEE